jgi:Kef-type K+ transport system membrane component KefB
MLLVFASAKLLGELFERLGQPGIVGEILAGVLLGPQLLGWMAPNDVIHVLSDLGVMFLLFRIGLEMKPAELLKVGGTATVVAIAGVIVPFFMGWGICRLWGEPGIESIFTGAAMVATSVGITGEVLAARGLLSTRAARIILAAAVVDDILGLLVLAVVTGLAQGSVNYLDIALTGVLSLGFTVFVARFGSRTAQRVIPRIGSRMRLAESEFILSLTLLFALSVLAVYAGVAAIIGAFLAGVALSEAVEERARHLTDGVTQLLAPFFLVNIGLQFDVSAFANTGTLELAGLILAAAVVSKFLGCGLGALRLGANDAIRVGAGMIPRGEVGMVVAQLGLKMGVVAHNVYGVIVFMSVMTTVIAPPLLKLTFRGASAKGDD